MEQTRAKLVELEAERTTAETAVAKLKREKVQLDETHRGLHRPTEKVMSCDFSRAHTGP